MHPWQRAFDTSLILKELPAKSTILQGKFSCSKSLVNRHLLKLMAEGKIHRTRSGAMIQGGNEFEYLLGPGPVVVRIAPLRYPGQAQTTFAGDAPW
jgi:hypothetical protein